MTTTRRALLGGVAAGVLGARAGLAAETVKIGLILPMTGPFQSTGKQIAAACRLYMQVNGSSVAGDAIELIVKDDAGVPDETKRLAQELVVNDKVAVIAGFGLTPLALAAAPIATRAKVPEIVMAAATAAITGASPYVVRSSTTIIQSVIGIAAMGAEERHQESRDAGIRLRAGHRCGDLVQEAVHRGGRRGHRRRCACRSPIPISRRSCSARRTRIRMRCSCSSRPASARR